jgi:CubicO group peptidase (beta-lactamase class C family)
MNISLLEDDSIAKFFNFVPDGKSAITVAHLLSHTSGLRNEVIALLAQAARRLSDQEETK